MERRFGHDFSQVRIRHGHEAAESASAFGAAAYTIGNDIALPLEASAGLVGQGLLAHELAHVVQQRSGGPPTGLVATSVHEKEADAAAKAFLSQDQPIRVLTRTGIGLALAPQSDARSSEAAQLPVSDGIPLYFPQDSTELRHDAAVDSRASLVEVVAAVRAHLRRHPGAAVVISGFASEEGSPEYNLRLSERRAARVLDMLVAEGLPAARLKAVGRGVSRGPLGRPWDRRVLVEVPFDSSLEEEPEKSPPRGFTSTEEALYLRLERLQNVAQHEGVEGTKFAGAIKGFRATLRARVMAMKVGDPLPPDLDIVMKALLLWGSDKGDQWGEGIWDSKDLTLSAAEYATVPASQNKCNTFVAEVLYQAVGTVHKVFESEEQMGRFFPYRAHQWSDPSQQIPNYQVVPREKMGDVWALEGHVGIYLGTYEGLGIYISARDNGDGVFALDKVQYEHGIQIKFMKPGGTFRRYVP
jgi:outer membrane protein OmpA-like peptidoglycan-associated protein